MRKDREWRVRLVTSEELQEALNELESEDFEVFSVLPAEVKRPDPSGRSGFLKPTPGFAILGRKETFEGPLVR
jgi:Glu-tRNA(Gln) amidotransferase subunit E-like FAD-binding protein